MSMRWEDETYVRVYTRDTVDWDMMCWQARCLLPLLLRKVDRAGLVELGRHGARGLAANVKLPIEVVECGLHGDPAQTTSPDGLLASGSVEIHGSVLVVPNFIDAQSASMSDALRKRESRARARDVARAVEMGLVTEPDEVSQNVTEGHETGQTVTPGHNASQPVTSGHSELCSALLISSERDNARARVGDDGHLETLAAWEAADLPGSPLLNVVAAEIRRTPEKQRPTAKAACEAYKQLVDAWHTRGYFPNVSPQNMLRNWSFVVDIARGAVIASDIAQGAKPRAPPTGGRRGDNSSSPETDAFVKQVW